MMINIYFSLIFSLFIISTSFANDHCTSSYCSVLDYQDEVDWTEHISDLWAWMSAQKSKNVVTFCRSDKATFSPTDFTHSPIKGPFPCAFGLYDTKYEGPLDKDELPKGNGRMTRMIQKVSQNERKNCFELLPTIESVHGRFVKGYPQGKATIRYTDKSFMEATFEKGIINGKVRIFRTDNKRGSSEKLAAVGLYTNGQPHGPFWVLSPNQEQFMQVHFNEGKLVPENTLLVDFEAEWAILGTLVNGSHLLNPLKIELDWVGEYNCMQVLRIPKEVSGEPLDHKVKLPSTILGLPESQRVLVKPSKMMFFNRVAKTGSQSFIHLLVTLGDKLGYKTIPQIRQRETVADNEKGIQEEVNAMVLSQENLVMVRHYNFIDFAKFGSPWHPDWFNLVRDPIDKIVSWFYYWRAAWNVVSRIRMFPREPLPDVDFLRKDFDTCVLTGDKECQYIQDMDSEDAGNHVSQIMQFCGHDPVCRKFNNPEALQIAKENVDKYYKVVGITENINMTLKVAEHEMPEYFENAFHVYHHDPEIRNYQMKNPYKLPVSEQVMEIVRANFTHEIEFYEFCKQRLQAQYQTILSSKNKP